MQKSRKGKELKTLPNLHPQTYITQISQIFHNPNELCYILIDCDNHIRMYDIPTMAILGRSEVKVREGFEVWRCLFDRNDVGVFYTIMRSKGERKKNEEEGRNEKGEGEAEWNFYSYIVNAHYLNRDEEILWKTCPIELTSEEILEEEISEEVNMDDFPKELKLIEEKISEKEPINIPNEIYVFEDEEIKEDNVGIGMDEEDNNIKEIMPDRRDLEDIDIELSGYEESLGEQNVIGEVLGEDSVEKELPNKAHTNLGGYQENDNFHNLIQVETKLNPEPTQLLWNQKYRILESSKFITKTQHIHQAEFTILTNKGLLMCSESGVKKNVEIEGDLVVGGSSFYGNGEWFTGKGEVGDMWILFGRETCFLLETHPVASNQLQSFNENHYPKIYETLSIKLHPFSHYKKVYTDNRKKLCLIVNTDNELVLISYGQKGSDSERNLLEIICKINMSNLQSGELGVKIENLSFYGILRFGSDTSTSDKYENKIMVLLGVKQVSAEQIQIQQPQIQQPHIQQPHIQEQIQAQPEVNNQAQSLMISEAAEEQQVNIIETKEPQIEKIEKPLSIPIQKPQPKFCDVHIYSLDLSQPFSPLSELPQMIFSNPPAPIVESPKELVTILPSFPECIEIWYNEYLENRLHFLDTNNKVHMIDMCRLLEGKNIGKEWVNLGYKFEALDGNELYEELEDEFEVTAEESKSCNDVDGKRGLKMNQLDDWSYCMVSKEAIVNKKLKRLNCIEF